MGGCIHEGADVCEPPEGPTSGHENCYTGMVDTDDFGELDGIGCSVGCVSCRDLPLEVRTLGSIDETRPPPGTHRDHGVQLSGAQRFLFPSKTTTPDEHVGADNRQYALSVLQPIWVKSGAEFWLGCCHTNFGGECFNDHSTCSCFREPLPPDGEDATCSDGTSLLCLLSGHFMDRFAYSGLGWSPNGSAFGLFSNSMYCRRFTPKDNCSIIVASVGSGGVYSASGRIPTIIRTSYQPGCPVDVFVFLWGVAASNTDCLDGYASSGGDQNHNVGLPYILITDLCHNVSAQVICRPETGDPPRFGGGPNFPLEDLKTFAIHNSVLERIWEEQWPDDNQPGGDMNFDYIDHLVPANSGVGAFG